MSTHLLETSDEDSFLLVARFVGDLINEGQERTALADTTGSRFTAECEALLSEQRYGDYLDRLLGQLDAVFDKAQEKDLECCLSILCHLAGRAPESLDRVMAALTAKTDAQPEARLAALVELYNVTPAPAQQYKLLLALVRYGLAAGLVDQLTPSLKSDVNAVLEEWQLDEPQRRDLLAAAAAVYRAGKKTRSSTRDAFELMMRCLDTVSSSTTAAEVAALKPAVLATVCAFIASPDLFTFDAWDSPAVQQLATDKEAQQVFGLLNVVTTGGVKEFEAFAKSAPGVFEQAGTTKEELLDKMRVLTIASMAIGKQEVAFSDIQVALGVPSEDVEGWVVRTVGRGLMEGKIDQLRGCVSVTQCACRTFGNGQWAELRERLSGWRTRLSGMQELVANQKAAFPKGMVPVIRAA